MTQYPTDLTKRTVVIYKKYFGAASERNRKHSLKEIMNAIPYINKTGSRWRMLPSDFAP